MKSGGLIEFVKDILVGKSKYNTEKRINYNYFSSDIIQANYNFLLHDQSSEMQEMFIDMQYDIEIAMDDLNLDTCDDKDYKNFMIGMLYSMSKIYDLKKREDISKKEQEQFFKSSKYGKDILLNIYKTPGINQITLAKKINVSSNNMSNIILRIHDNSLLYMLPVGRENQFYLTELGKKYIKDIVINEKKSKPAYVLYDFEDEKTEESKHTIFVTREYSQEDNRRMKLLKIHEAHEDCVVVEWPPKRNKKKYNLEGERRWKKY